MGDIPPVLDYSTPVERRDKLSLGARIVLGAIALPVTVVYGALFGAALLDGLQGIGWAHFAFVFPFILVPLRLMAAGRSKALPSETFTGRFKLTIR
jgi:hypothetical protein